MESFTSLAKLLYCIIVFVTLYGAYASNINYFFVRQCRPYMMDKEYTAATGYLYNTPRYQERLHFH